MNTINKDEIISKLKDYEIMKNLCEFAENIIANNSVEVMIEVICSLSDEDIRLIANG